MLGSDLLAHRVQALLPAPGRGLVLRGGRAGLVSASRGVRRDQCGDLPAGLGDDRDATGEVGHPDERNQPAPDVVHR